MYIVGQESMTDSTNPLVSVIIAVLNARATIKRCLVSYQEQSFNSKELIVIDGGSKDGTKDVLDFYSDLINYYSSEPDKGIYCAWNKGLVQAKGQWICFLGSDDYFLSFNSLEQYAFHLNRMPGKVQLVYCKGAIVNEKGSIIDYKGEEWNRERFLKEMIIFHPGAMHHRNLFRIHGNFDESFKISGDYEFLLREYKDADNEVYYVPDLVCVAAQRSGTSVLLKNRLLIYKEKIYAYKKNDIKVSFFFKLCLFCRALVQYSIWRIFGDHYSHKIANFYRFLSGKKKYWN